MTASTPAASPLSVFISYAHRDEDFKDELVVHLANLKRQGKISAWQDRDIEAGAEWHPEIQQQLEAAEIILLLISPPFIASEYCYDLEMRRALERHDAGTARAIPIILRPADWQDTPFSKLQVLPKDAKPITKWADRDEAFVNVVQGIRRAVESLQAKKSSGPTTANVPAAAPTATSGTTTAQSPVATAASPSPMTAFQCQRLEQQQTALQAEWHLKMEQLTSLRQALAIEASPSPKFQLQKQVQTAETELVQLENQLAKIEQDLTNSNPQKK